MGSSPNVILLSSCDPLSGVELRSAVDYACIHSCSSFTILPFGCDYMGRFGGPDIRPRVLLSHLANADVYDSGCEHSSPTMRVFDSRGTETTLNRLSACISALKIPVHVLISADQVSGATESSLTLASVADVCSPMGATVLLLNDEAVDPTGLPQGCFRVHDHLRACTLSHAWASPSHGSGPASLALALTAHAHKPSASTDANLACWLTRSVMSAMTRYGLCTESSIDAIDTVPAGQLWRKVGGWSPNAWLQHALQRVSAGEDSKQLASASLQQTLPHRIGVLGGSFNPPTVAHMNLACHGLASGAVDEVWIVPCGPRPDKPALSGPGMPSPWQRHVMTVLAVEACVPASVPVRVMPLELLEPVAVATFTLMSRLAAFASSMHTDKMVEFSLMIGMDLLPTLHTWRHAEQLLNDTRFLVFPRPGAGPDVIPVPPGAQAGRAPAHVQVVSTLDGQVSPSVQASSTEVRARVLQAYADARGRDAMCTCSVSVADVMTRVHGMVPGPVARYIAAHRLYSEL